MENEEPNHPCKGQSDEHDNDLHVAAAAVSDSA